MIPEPSPLTPEREKIVTLGKILLLAFLMVGAALLYWGVVRSPFLVARSDNPRVLEAELRTQRGAIVDRAGVELARNEGTADRQERHYAAPEAGHVVGYYSLLHGTAGAEAGFDAQLRGDHDGVFSDHWRQTLHLPRTGDDVQLALDYRYQAEAVKRLSGNRGAALLLEIPYEGDKRAWVRALASAPDYDANTLDETFEELSTADDAPLLNRATHGRYQPGLLLQPFVIASAVDQGLIRLDEQVADAGRPVVVNDTTLRCAGEAPDPATWADVLAYRCPGPMLDLADRLGISGLDFAFSSFALDTDPVFELDTESTANEATADPLLAAIGQESLSITPLQLGLAMGALAVEGTVPQPQLGVAVAAESGDWQPWLLEDLSSTAVSSRTARAIRLALPQQGGISEMTPAILSGPDGTRNAWYAGILPAENAAYVAIVVIEDNDTTDQAAGLGRRLLEMAGS